MADLTWEEFALALAPSLGVPGKPSHELTVVAERVYDALVEAGVDIRAVVEGREQRPRVHLSEPANWEEDARRALRIGYEVTLETQSCEEMATELVRLLKLARANSNPDLSRLRELIEKWRTRKAETHRMADGNARGNAGSFRMVAGAWQRASDDLTAALDAIEKGGA